MSALPSSIDSDRPHHQSQLFSSHFSYLSFLRLVSYAFSTVSQRESRSDKAVRRAVSEDSLSIDRCWLGAGWGGEGSEGRDDVPYIWIRTWMWFSEGCGTLSRNRKGTAVSVNV